MISIAAIRKEARLCCGSFLRKGEVFAHGRLTQNLKNSNVPPERDQLRLTTPNEGGRDLGEESR